MTHPSVRQQRAGRRLPAVLRSAASRACLAALVCTGLVTPACAAPATPEEAARLTALLQTYTGVPAPGAPPAVTVTPTGDTYRAAIDLARLATPLHDFGVDVVVSEPLVLTLTPLPDGTWRVARGNFPPFGVTTRKGVTYSVRFDGFSTDGVFDPRLQCFSRVEATGGATKTSVSDGTTVQHSEVTHTSRQIAMAQGPTASDVASTIHQDYADTRYRTRIEPAPTTGGAAPSRAPAAPLDVSLTLDAATGDLATRHENVAAVYPLWAFLVAHPSRQQLLADQDRLRQLALAMVPYANGISARAEAKGLSVDAGTVKAKVAALSETFALGDGEANGGIAFSLKFGGLAIAANDALPEWTSALIPESLDLNLQTSPLDLAGASRVLVQSADLATEEVVPGDAVARALETLSPSRPVSLEVKPSVIANKTLSIAAAGDVAGTGLHVEADGIDRAVTLLSKSEDPLADQVAQALSAAQLLGKPGANGRLVWDVQLTKGGLSVNGQLLR